MGDPQNQTTTPTPPPIDWSKYQQNPSSPTIDFSKYSGGAADSTSDAQWNALKDKYGLPHNVDLSKSLFENIANLHVEGQKETKIDPIKFSKAYQEANPQPATPTSFLGRSWDEIKNLAGGAFGTGALFGDPTKTSSVAGTTPPDVPGAVEGVKQRASEAIEHPAAALGAGAVDVAAAAVPFITEGAGKIWSKISPAATIEEAMGRKLSLSEADTPRPGGQIQPALNNTPREVLQHASDEGIKLTPGQATEDAMAQNLQKAGTTAAVGGKDLSNALALQKTKFGESVNNFMDDVDPKRMGLSAEGAGESIQNTAKVAKDVSHENASQGYKQIDYLMDKPVDPAPITKAWNQIKAGLPMGAEEGILAQTPRSMRAVVEDMLSGRPEGFQPTFSQAIQLRSFFREMGETEGLPSKTQGIYQQMSKAADSAAEATAGNLGAADDWRAANAGWKDYATKYGNPQSVLYKAIRQTDPVKTVTMLQNAPATDIEILKKEAGDAALEPLRRQVVQDIAQSRFNVGHDGLGGYSDAYLKTLFDPATVKELYLKADLANRLKYDPNPSGTGANIASMSQLGFWNQAKMSTAAKLSMPRDPLSFLPSMASSPSATRISAPLIMKAKSPITGGETANPDELFQRANQ